MSLSVGDQLARKRSCIRPSRSAFARRGCAVATLCETHVAQSPSPRMGTQLRAETPAAWLCRAKLLQSSQSTPVQRTGERRHRVTTPSVAATIAALPFPLSQAIRLHAARAAALPISDVGHTTPGTVDPVPAASQDSPYCRSEQPELESHRDERAIDRTLSRQVRRSDHTSGTTSETP